MASDILSRIQAELIKQFKVQQAPPISLSGGISPAAVIASLNPADPAFLPGNFNGTQPVAPGAGTIVATTGKLNEGCYDFSFDISVSTLAAARQVAFIARDAGLVGKQGMLLILPAGARNPIIQNIAFDVGDQWDVVIQVITAFAAGEQISGGIRWKQRTCG